MSSSNVFLLFFLTSCGYKNLTCSKKNFLPIVQDEHAPVPAHRLQQVRPALQESGAAWQTQIELKQPGAGALSRTKEKGPEKTGSVIFRDCYQQRPDHSRHKTGLSWGKKVTPRKQFDDKKKENLCNKRFFYLFSFLPRSCQGIPPPPPGVFLKKKSI